MKKLSELFSRFVNFVPPERVLKEKVISEIKEHSGIQIEPKYIIIEKGNVRIIVSPAIKVRVLIKKEAIMNGLQADLGDNAPRDII
jgi:hypothetical protein